MLESLARLLLLALFNPLTFLASVVISITCVVLYVTERKAAKREERKPKTRRLVYMILSLAFTTLLLILYILLVILISRIMKGM